MAGGAAQRTERLMCLVFILKARGRRGITRSELRAVIEDYRACTSEDAFERMFERDKRDLRDVGIGMSTYQRDAYHEDQTAYTLDTDSLLTLPALDAEELRMLSLAALAWEQGTWDALAHGGLHKLEVFGDELADVSAPRVTVSTGPHLDALRDAIRRRRAVQFSYRRPGDADPAERHVEPWGLLSRGNAWYCVGFDLDRRAARVFRTSRITDVVRDAGAATAPVDPEWPAIPQSDASIGVTVPSTLLVLPGRGWHWRAQGTPQGTATVADTVYDVFACDLADDPTTVGALAAAAPAVLVREPAALRERVIAHLTEVSHG